MVSADTQAAAMLKPDSSAGAKATLKDGRVVSLKASIDPPRPSVSLIGKSRSEEHTSELQSLMRTSYAVFCLKKKKSPNSNQTPIVPMLHPDCNNILNTITHIIQ